MQRRSNLVFVIGGSPQIITETVYCLLGRDDFSADVHVLTTQAGDLTLMLRAPYDRDLPPESATPMAGLVLSRRFRRIWWS